jgi:hypothetical protein
MSPDTTTRGSIRHVALVVLFAVVVTVAGIAPAVAGSPAAASAYQISEMDAPAAVTAGESFTVSATLSNPGEIDMQVVAFRIDANGDGEFTPSESLGAEAFVLLAGDSRNVTFDVTAPAGLAPGEYEYVIWTESNSVTGTITVEAPVAPATFLLAGMTAPESVAATEAFVVSASLANVGDLDGTQNLTLYLDTDRDGMLSDEAVLGNTTFELAAASNGSVNVSAVAPDVAPGDYAFTLTTGTERLDGVLTVEMPPAPFEVVSLDSGRAMTSGTLSVSAIVKNVGDERRTGVVELRLDANRDGTFAPEETVRSRTVTLGAGSSQSHGFAVALPNSYTPGEYDLALVTPGSERVDSFEVFQPGPTTTSSSTPATTLEDVAQALYGEGYDGLTDGQKFDVQDVYTRLPGEIPLSEMETRQQISQRLYETDFLVDSRHASDQGQYALTKTQAVNVQNTYDAQFGPLPTSPQYSVNDVAVGLFGANYEVLGAENAYQIYAVYNRQPYADGLRFESDDVNNESVTDVIRTQRQVARVSYDGVFVFNTQTLDSEPGLDLARLLAVHENWSEQFEDN